MTRSETWKNPARLTSASRANSRTVLHKRPETNSSALLTSVSTHPNSTAPRDDAVGDRRVGDVADGQHVQGAQELDGGALATRRPRSRCIVSTACFLLARGVVPASRSVRYRIAEQAVVFSACGPSPRRSCCHARTGAGRRRCRGRAVSAVLIMRCTQARRRQPGPPRALWASWRAADAARFSRSSPSSDAEGACPRTLRDQVDPDRRDLSARLAMRAGRAAVAGDR